MRLHRITLNPRSKDARRDLADPYQMHATLCRAFFPQDTPCPPGALLWRQEPEADVQGYPRALIQSQAAPEWSRLLESGWLAQTEPGIDLVQKLALESLAAGQTFRFRLRANPCKTVQGKRTGLVHPDAQRDWLARKGEQHGFALPAAETQDYFDFVESPEGRAYPDVRISQDQMLTGRKHDGITIRVFSVLYEGRLTVTDVAHFKKALETGIGHGKVMGLGLLSVVPTR
ncbi:type I-E CRISPR-associated protein Cas6/Cse3/CasE [Acidithiobacillus sp. CV18-2]|nr:type I-E CRISPR-associated protein Cas6/Cse3/CasE [Acidithiobacillus sp. CV18-3]MBU2758323.1 type I-E CRISPR-associated protein Cas6/Cse3/CasE [Acidithiobacillus sp. BN09-2]MBU2775946.1 type I-E CRISPR-associated protein Cas6/Cse3/CasE [Acidithiobacillus sp. CV18-2]MBU2798846.1 type I-E CRISPR-associated protein Cas6/Cse3/CasE [Acidithiobacillus sp. VAN18-4]